MDRLDNPDAPEVDTSVGAGVHRSAARSVPALLAMLAVFALLWLPLGQQAFLAEHSTKVGTFAAPMLVFTALAMRRMDDGPLTSGVLCLPIAVIFLRAVVVGWLARPRHVALGLAGGLAPTWCSSRGWSRRTCMGWLRYRSTVVR